MSAMQRITLANVMSFLALFTTLCGGSFAIGQRQQDLSYIQQEVGELKKFRENDHETLMDLKNDMKHIKLSLEGITLALRTK